MFLLCKCFINNYFIICLFSISFSSITFISGVTDVVFIPSTNIIAVRTTLDDGSFTDFNDAFVTNPFK